jgi:hypothetical protein
VIPSFLSFIFAVVAATVGRPSIVQPVQPMSREEMEIRVRIDAARTLQVEFDDVQVLEAAERMWPDTELGCRPRQPDIEPKPTPGFLVVAKVKAARVTYHTDRAGLVLRCDLSAKKRKSIG